jgi:hypothetical protein
MARRITVSSNYSYGVPVVFEQAAESLVILNRSALRFRSGKWSLLSFP